MNQSKFRDVMISHSRRDTEKVVRDFKKAQPPLILVSPSMATGWDFPDDECRWQIIVKLPYPDTRGNIIKARSKQDPDFTSYLVMQQLIQACGRGVRSDHDWCETFVTDNNITWFIVKSGHLAVNWFEEAYSARTTIPRPMIMEV
jgi:Rad3-related DNA helicase